MVTKENRSAESKKRFQSTAAGVGAEEESEEGEADSHKDLVAVGANTISHWQINGTAWGNINNHDTQSDSCQKLSFGSGEWTRISETSCRLVRTQSRNRSRSRDPEIQADSSCT
ncbi:hypothetical protein NQZ68_009927, partial [Dissostichus eleginoides]